jgi:tetratricopeptide (TPR) repeat protein
MGCYRYQDAVATVPEDGIIAMLWEELKPRAKRTIKDLRDRCLIKFSDQDKGYFLHPVMRAEAVGRLKDECGKWTKEGEEANRKAAEFWTEYIKTIEITDDALKAFEAYHHYLLIDDIDLASSMIVEERKNKWDQSNKDTYAGEPLGYSFIRFGLLESITIAIQVVIFRVIDKLILAELHNLVGDIFWLVGKPHIAIQNHEKTNDIVQNIYIKANSNLIKDKIHQLSYASLMNRGLCYLSLWDINKAHDLFLQIEDLSNQLNYKNSVRPEKYLFRAIFCLSLTYSLKTDINRTFLYIEKYKTITNQIDVDIYDSWSRGYSLIFIAQAYKNIEFLSDSIFKYEEAIEYSNSSGYSQVNAISLYGIGEIEREKYNNVSSLSNIQIAVEILKKIGATHDLAEAYFQLGLTYQAVGEHDQAKTYKDKALELSKHMEAPKQIERVDQAFEQGAKQ